MGGRSSFSAPELVAKIEKLTGVGFSPRTATGTKPKRARKARALADHRLTGTRRRRTHFSSTINPTETLSHRRNSKALTRRGRSRAGSVPWSLDTIRARSFT